MGHGIKTIIYRLVLGALLVAASSSLLTADYFPKDSYLHYVKYLLYQRSSRHTRALAELILAYQANPEAQELLSDIVEMALDLKHLEIAKSYSQRAMEVAPKKAWSLLLGAEVLQAEEKTDEALGLLERAFHLEPSNPEVLLHSAAINAELGKRKEASRYMDLYLEIAPGSVEILKLKANLELQDKNSRSMKSYREAYEAGPNDEEALEGLIASYQVFSSTQALIQLLNEIASRGPEDTNLSVRICQLEGGSVERRACFEELLKSKPNLAVAVLGLAETYEVEERWEEAIDVLRDRREVFGKDPTPSLKESFYLLRLNRQEEAIKVLESEAAANPDEGRVAYFLALGYQDTGRLQDSKTQLEKIYSRWPQWKEPAYNYALICGELGEIETMEKVLSGLWKIYPSDPVILNALGYTLAEEGKDLSQAKTLIEEALCRDPENPSYRDSLGWIYFKMGETQRALEVLEAVASQAKDPEVLIHLATILNSRAKYREAWERFYSAKFELARTKSPGERLPRELNLLEKTLRPAMRPAPQALLAKGVESLNGFSMMFRCDWKIARLEGFRSKMWVRRLDGENSLKILVWPPGSFVPVALADAADLYPEAKEILTELSEGMQGFFVERPWIASQDSALKRWKVQNDFSVRFFGNNLSLAFLDFYRVAESGLAPRFIQMEGRRVKSVCEMLGSAFSNDN